MIIHRFGRSPDEKTTVGSFVGTTYNFKRIVCACQSLNVSDVEQRSAVLNRANFELLISRLIAKPRFHAKAFRNGFCGKMKDCA